MGEDAAGVDPGTAESEPLFELPLAPGVEDLEGEFVEGDDPPTGVAQTKLGGEWAGGSVGA